jgi:hypothetical protein
MGVGGHRHGPATLHPGNDPVPILKEAGWGPGAGLDGCGISRQPLGFDPRTVQPIASCYTNYAIPSNGFVE